MMLHPSRLAVAVLIGLLLTPRSGAAQSADEVVPITIRPVESWHIDYATHHVQGLSVDETHFWITSVDRRARQGWVFRVDRESLEVTERREVSIAAQYHPGGFQRQGDRLVIPIAEYRPRSTSTVVLLDARTFETTASFPVADHLGATAVDRAGRIYAANWDTRTIYVFDAQGSQLESHENPTGVAYQDFEWHDGTLYAAGWTHSAGEGAAVIDVVDTTTWKLKRRYRLEPREEDHVENFAREGFSLSAGSFYLLPEDGPRSTVYRFAIPQR